MLSRWATVAGVLITALMPLQASAERRVALVIGNAAYQQATALRNPVNDANDVAELLKKSGFEVVLGLDLDQQKFAATLEQFARLLDDADVGLLFYAGHGLQMNEKNYLVSVNARLDSEFMLSSETIELDAIVRLMESKAPINLVFLDACRNNPLTENLRRNMTALKRGAQLGRGLARVEASGRDTLIAFSAAPGQEAADGADRNSPFTAALLRHLPQPGLEVSVMLKDVAADVRRDTRNAQRPQQLSDMTRAFYFNGRGASAALSAETPAASVPPTPAQPAAAATGGDDRTLDVAFWNAAQSSNDCEAVRAYRRRFPNGVFVELAKLSERRLCGAGRTVTMLEPIAKTPAAATADPSPSATAAPAASAPPSPAPPSNAVGALPGQTKTEMLTEPASDPSRAELARSIQLELHRLGCAGSEADGKWSLATREAVRKFNKHKHAKLDPSEPSNATVTALQKQSERACPLECERGYRAKGNTCVAAKAEPSKKQRRAQRAERTPARRARHPEAAPEVVYEAPPPPHGGLGGLPVGIMFGFGRRH